MKTHIICLLALIFVFLFSLNAPAKQDLIQTKCPVMGYTPNEELYTDYQDKRIYFCCASCPEKFTKNPEQYLQKLEDQGVTLEDAPEASAGTKSADSE
jgi:YHS domain-containing protein